MQNAQKAIIVAIQDADTRAWVEDELSRQGYLVFSFGDLGPIRERYHRINPNMFVMDDVPGPGDGTSGRSEAGWLRQRRVPLIWTGNSPVPIGADHIPVNKEFGQRLV